MVVLLHRDVTGLVGASSGTHTDHELEPTVRQHLHLKVATDLGGNGGQEFQSETAGGRAPLPPVEAHGLSLVDPVPHWKLQVHTQPQPRVVFAPGSEQESLPLGLHQHRPALRRVPLVHLQQQPGAHLPEWTRAPREA
ncbi:hypothetical protein Dgeo_2682 (plasmid) [Deinococcus geothermalis DSM 11300]|uniref:Uncharacterized protein n=1 Tax=Deinococcus geothermalis (strain DSM 11300 / CIP 105573 / AG-3a) TaxID=319795 RepID=Q1J319_DEIGD|nr:hypothetical protein Dgeo_2682 [Deinococcus geothermalis DSM 11300]